MSILMHLASVPNSALGCFLSSQKPCCSDPIKFYLPGRYTALPLITHSISSSPAQQFVVSEHPSCSLQRRLPGPALAASEALTVFLRPPNASVESLAAISHPISLQINSLMDAVLCRDSRQAISLHLSLTFKPFSLSQILISL